MKKKKNRVFILGAGSSKDFGLPLGNEVFSQAKELLMYRTYSSAHRWVDHELKYNLEYVKKILNQIFTNLPKDEKQYPNFEEVLTLIWEARKYDRYEGYNNISLFKKDAEIVFDRFVELLTHTLFWVINSDPHKEWIRPYEEFIKSFNFKKENITFISLNYDTILDTILNNCVKEKIIQDFNYGFPFRHMLDDVSCRKGGVLLLKPHGSLNLSFCNRHFKGGTRFYYYEQDIMIAKAEGINTIQCSYPLCEHYVRPLVIPPLYGKTSYVATQHKKVVGDSIRIAIKRSNRGVGAMEQYRTLVDKKICDVLKHTDEITMIGYSMPTYDFDFKFLLIKALMSNKKRSKIPINIITKGNTHSVNELKLRFEHLAGKINIIDTKGFSNYLRG